MIHTTPPPVIQEYICGGGYTDEKGQIWDNIGRFWSKKYPTDKELKQHCKFVLREQDLLKTKG